MKKTGITIWIICFAGLALSQTVTYQTSKMPASKMGSVNLQNIQDDWMPLLQNLEMPKPGSERANLIKMKKEIAEKYPRNKNKDSYKTLAPDTAPDPMLRRNFMGNSPAGIPNDNSMAVSDNGILISATNSKINIYDTEKDSLIKVISLSYFSSQLGLSNLGTGKYDPKMIYDPLEDRFILVFLYEFTWQNSKIIVCFTESNDPTGNWNCYALSGNPINDSTWSDYPAIAITRNELFITVNLLKNGLPWQTGFVQTVIWQLNKYGGYKGDSLINTQLWSGISYDSTKIRNLHPVTGGSTPYGPNEYFVSNRNFTYLSDSIFTVEITDTINSTSSVMKIKLGHTSPMYGVPPFARQANGHEFDTNDGRVLGAFLENGQIQFVSNTIDTSTGNAAVYHGFISGMDSSVKVYGNILGDTLLDLGYPNISYSGQNNCDNEAIITVDHTAPTVFAGFSAIYYGNLGNYSRIMKIKEGDNYVDKIAGTYERWGDYSGSQRKYNAPGTVWVSGYYGDSLKRNGTWIGELKSVDSTLMFMSVSTSDPSGFGLNNGYATASVSNGNDPLIFLWNDPAKQSGITASGLGDGNYTVMVSDASNCTLTDTIKLTQPLPEAGSFPNPSADQIYVNFTMEEDNEIEINIYGMGGNHVKSLTKTIAREGRNIFSFSTGPLTAGAYIVIISSGKNIILTKKFIKL